MGASAFLAWVTTLPLTALYAVLALAAAVENFIPPLPSDTVVAFGSFLAARGHGALWATFLAVWIGNLAGAMGVYAVARRYGAERLERRLLGNRAEQVEATLENYYGRFGLVALFLGRFIPGVRAFVPLFAAAMRVRSLTTAVLIGAASAIWYGVISYVGYTVGSDWPAVVRVLSRDGRDLAIGAVALVLILGAIVLINRRKR